MCFRSDTYPAWISSSRSEGIRGNGGYRSRRSEPDDPQVRRMLLGIDSHCSTGIIQRSGSECCADLTVAIGRWLGTDNRKGRRSSAREVKEPLKHV